MARAWNGDSRAGAGHGCHDWIAAGRQESTLGLAYDSPKWPSVRTATDGRRNGKLTRLTPDELAALRRPPRIKDPKERLAAVRRATMGLRVGVEVTRSFYRPS